MVTRGATPGDVELVQAERPERRSGEILVGVQAVAIAPDEYTERGPGAPGRVGVGIVLFGAGSIVAGSRVGFGPVLRCRGCAACRTGGRVRCEREIVFGADRPGALAEVVAIPRTAVVPLPSAITAAEGAAALLHWPAALRLIRDAGGLEAGDRVVVLGANLPLGVATVQLAAGFEAEIESVASHGDSPGPGPYDTVLVAGGSAAAVAAAVAALRPGGVISVATDTVELQDLDLDGVITRQQRLVGSRGATDGDVRSVREWLAASSARPVIAGRYRLTEAKDALAHAARRPPGEIVVHVSEEQ